MSIRNTPPPVMAITELPIPKAELLKLDNDILVYHLPIGNQEVIKLELIFEAGRWQEQQKMQSRLTAKMLKMGTNQHTAVELAERLEYFGTKLKINDEFDSCSLQIFCLKKHFEPILALIFEILTESTFPTNELEMLIKRNKERLKVDICKGDFTAYRTLTEKIFGNEHPYGYNSSFELYDSLQPLDLKSFYNQAYTAANCKIILTGKTDLQTIHLLNKHLGKLPIGQKISAQTYENSPVVTGGKFQLFLDKKDNMQTSIRIGRRLFNKSHADYAGFYVLNTVFGGYFGARLMQNLREDKGYTYGVYSSTDDLLHDGYFYIDTEVGQEVKTDAVAQIYKEMDILQDKLIPKTELAMVKSYLMGTFLNGLDGFFNVSSLLSDMVKSNLNMDFISNLIAVSQSITSKELRELARTYLDKNYLCEVLVS
jgi:zinc protease